ncbi:hypothetical protein [Vagococcus xieshaowenii]|uniref:Uncharacterized protein n=1 Tax=Vagococcus xieshaowenii TaxID=2562451 RepID=A0A4Z0DCC0_9ENTE|nr:hypothetical protein [Vagococcus xieshaowenii]QCA28204.1 hypothetical protein E4Z98_02320 [Vagococcus xieshaowenii]TFZ42556.1 hypothetical protein E4031_03245 [Vagococcus xieshaowenii]
MDNYLEMYANWYPTTYQLSYYPMQSTTALSVSKRTEIYQTLTDDQQALLNKHRKFKIRSLFLKNNYLQDSDWTFETVNTDWSYDRKEKSYHLFCDCGKALKYQFVLKSIKSKRRIKLGISHFADHLGISQVVANEIKTGVNHIDIALDELLWLKDRGYQFPEDLWKKYAFALYRNNTLKRPVHFNQRLAQRVLEFRDINMPIFIADYRALLDEIAKVNKQVFDSDERNFVANQAIFEAYYEDLTGDMKQSYFKPDYFFNRKFTFQPVDDSTKKGKRVALVSEDFKELLDVLKQIEQAGDETGIVLFKSYLKHNQRLVMDIDLYWMMYAKFKKYHFNQNFFLGIPKVYRNGLLRAIRGKEVTKKEIKPEKKEVAPTNVSTKKNTVLKTETKELLTLWERIDHQDQEAVLKEFLELINKS